MPELQLSDEDIVAAGLSAANVDAMKKAYLALSKKEETRAARSREKELKALGKLAASLAPKVSAALENIGVDVKKLEKRLRELPKNTSPRKIPQIEKLGGKDELELQKELASVGINEREVIDNVLKVINPPLSARVERRGLFTLKVTSVSTAGSRNIKSDRSEREK